MSDDSSITHPIPERAVVAVIINDAKFLTIKRSEQVRAPGKICFPGGGIEPGESEVEALVREIKEELGVGISVRQKIWQSVTPWGIHVSWYLAKLDNESFQIDKAEVAWCRWLSQEEITSSSELLESNAQFFDALQAGDIDLS